MKGGPRRWEKELLRDVTGGGEGAAVRRIEGRGCRVADRDLNGVMCQGEGQGGDGEDGGMG